MYILKILHVTESFGGGVTSAINTYVANSSQFEHYLYATVRSNDATGEEDKGEFNSVYFPKRNINTLMDFYKTIKKVKPQVIHVHSAIAGFIIRLLPFISCPIIYTPHAYPFLRNDNHLKLKAYYFIEKILSYRATAIAACSADEARLAKVLNTNKPVFELVNIAGELPVNNKKSIVEVNSKIKIGISGRVCEQKGVDFFIEVAKSIDDTCEFIWIGGGEEELVNKLLENNIRVTGWLEREAVLEQLRLLDLFFYTAAWDGFPISVLEAAKLNIPLLLREIGPFKTENLFCVGTESQAVDIIEKFNEKDSHIMERLVTVTKEINTRHSTVTLKKQLNSLYLSFKGEN